MTETTTKAEAQPPAKTRTTAALHRFAAILAVTAASYGLQVPPQSPASQRAAAPIDNSSRAS